jgi:DNA (cytosine-5)-methyltransferase 1
MKRKIMHDDLSLLSLFTGLGGLDLGLEASGFRSLGFLESDPIACQSLAINRPEWEPIEPSEVNAASRALTPRQLGLRRGDLALLAGAPPCQPFSKAAQWSSTARRGLRDPRSRCISGMMRLVEGFLPRVMLIENVEGFVRGRGSAVASIKRHLDKVNCLHGTRYLLQHWIVDAAHYGVPQHRRRAILVAEREGRSLQLPASTHDDEPLTAWDALHDMDVDVSGLPSSRHWLTLLPSIPEGQNYLWHTERGGGLQLFGYRTRYWSFLLKLAKNRPAWTLSAQPGPYTGPFHWDNRVLAVPEMLRLQTFPRDWKVEGSRSQQVRQIGNATPPLLAEVIGRAIAAQFFGRRCRQSLRLHLPRASRPYPVRERLLQVPLKFRRMQGKWPAHPGTGRGPKPVPNS